MQNFTKDDVQQIDSILANVLHEDLGPGFQFANITEGDVTSNLSIFADKECSMNFVTREEIVVCGIKILEFLFAKFEGQIKFQTSVLEGELVSANTNMMTISGKAKLLLSLERVALNLLQRMCAVSTETKKYVDLVKHTKAKILDTRKTTPGLRILEKYAVEVAGGKNHRFGLFDGILIKDNHIAVIGSIKKAIENAKENLKAKNLKLPIEIECDDLTQFSSALAENVDIILLDNMSISEIKEAVKLRKDNKVILEVSGGVNLSNVKQIAETGVDFISIGAITHSAPHPDIGLDVVQIVETSLEAL